MKSAERRCDVLSRPSEQDVLDLSSLGFPIHEIAAMLDCHVLHVRQILNGRGTRRVRHERREVVSSVGVGRYVAPAMRYEAGPVESESELYHHGPVRQLMRDGKPVNEIIWKGSASGDE